VIKQADTILALFLLGEQFSLEEKKRNFDYYDPLTTHDSSLSVCIQSIVAAEIGYMEKAREYFDFAAVMDLADVGGNMMHGAHIASIGGTWLALVYGFGGMRDYGGHISFRPRLPSDWRRVSFRLTIRDSSSRSTSDRTRRPARCATAQASGSRTRASRSSCGPMRPPSAAPPRRHCPRKWHPRSTLRRMRTLVSPSPSTR
jgi:trehalose/maltose hydrolase-like predicted phosphorylase